LFGIEEVLLISVIVLVIFGPDKLPEVARVLGKVSKEFRKVTDTAKFTWDEISREAELQDARSKRPEDEKDDLMGSEALPGITQGDESKPAGSDVRSEMSEAGAKQGQDSE
jgi:sec-independent protein translocase protein TatA